MQRPSVVSGTGPARAVPVIVYAAVVLVASVADPPAGGLTPAGPLGLVGVDKWLHAVGYATLTLLVAYALSGATKRWPAVAVAVAAIYGAGIEVVQSVLPFRSFDVLDVLANTLGALLVGIVVSVVSRRSEAA
ncbi:VanZ family protein [Halorientalis pallida]|uniref:VanZ family protein n=1 Tax=Halorientalis pallida TaxID=2479928 RepID=A0A498KSJ4_9EURY|nr:VanZ family protein [Halorientalis pallida]RXK47488.1 VanZ family protein [Halorientalis pallida]